MLACVDAQSEILIFENLLGEELLDEVVDAYKPSVVLSYSNAKDLMYGTIYRENDSVSCVYSGHTIYLPSGVDPSTFLYMNGSTSGINAEHTYPRSKGASEGNAHSDMHHLFPTRSPVNSSRSNFPFGEIEDNLTTSWFYLNVEENETPEVNIDQYSERINGMFEPREDHKGNVARAVFYFYTMYKEEALNADPHFFDLQRETLCEWHRQDPVDLLEWERTYQIAQYQNDLPNPYILDSTLVGRAFGGGLVSDIEKPQTTGVNVYPNPIIDVVTVISPGDSQVQVMDIYGHVLMKYAFSDSMGLDFSFLNSGSYFIIINGQAKKVLKL